MMVCVCCVPAQQCCCDEAGFRVLTGADECANEPFPVPDPAKSATVVFEWCGLTGVDATQGGQNTYFDDEVLDEFVCDTTGRYGEGVASYTHATKKELSVTILSGGSGTCGYQKSFIVGTSFTGVGYKLFGDGNYYGVESPITVENYDCTVYQCFDGSAAVVTMGLISSTTDDTCGGTGNFDPCKFTTPEVTVIVAP